MEHYYPCKGSSSQAENFCTSCNTEQNPSDACTSSESKNGVSNAYTECSSFCDTTVCNSSCNTAQTVCVTMGQYIKNHEDVGGYPIDDVKVDDIIAEKWSIDFWDSLIDKLETTPILSECVWIGLIKSSILYVFLSVACISTIVYFALFYLVLNYQKFFLLYFVTSVASLISA